MSDRTHRRSSSHRLAFVSVLGLAALLLPAAGPSIAGHGPDAAGGPYHGFATGTIVHADVLTSGATRLLDLEVGVGEAAVHSEGLKKVLSEFKRLMVPAEAGKHSFGKVSLVEVGALLNPEERDNQLRPFVDQVLAPAKAAVNRSVLKQQLGTFAYADVLKRVAEADWNGTTCVVGKPIAEGSHHIAQIELMEMGSKEGGEEGFDAAAVALEGASNGSERGVSSVVSREWLYKGEGPGLGLYSVVSATIAPVTFFEGQQNEFSIEFGGPSFLVARADGTPGGAEVSYRAPLVTVVQGGNETFVLPRESIVVRIPGSGTAIAKVSVNAIEPLKSPKGLGGDTTASNGTRAAAEANVVKVELLHAVPQSLRGATFALGHMEAAATVPVGGITCPIPVSKSASPEAVAIGEEFATNITVRNPFACPVTNVVLEDDITTTAGARFEVVGSEPSASTPVGGGVRNSGSGRWNLGTIEPGESKTVVLRMTGQGGAGRIEDTATATGTLSNCPVSPASAGADVAGLARAAVPVVGAATLSEPVTQVLGVQIGRGTLAATGVAAPIAGGGALVLAALLGGRTLRRRARS